MNMDILYDSSNYTVVDYGRTGVELVDKSTRRGAFLEGQVAHKLRVSMEQASEDEPTEESLDELLGYFDALLTTPITLH
jgi:hypothetical protein